MNEPDSRDPYLALLHLLGVLAAAELADRRRGGARLVLAVWAASQFAWRAPTVFTELVQALAGQAFVAVYREEPFPVCPQRLMELRSGPKRGIDSARIHFLCMYGKEPPQLPMPN